MIGSPSLSASESKSTRIFNRFNIPTYTRCRGFQMTTLDIGPREVQNPVGSVMPVVTLKAGPGPGPGDPARTVLSVRSRTAAAPATGQLQSRFTVARPARLDLSHRGSRVVAAAAASG